jgi:hypothetical protein
MFHENEITMRKWSERESFVFHIEKKKENLFGLKKLKCPKEDLISLIPFHLSSIPLLKKILNLSRS